MNYIIKPKNNLKGEFFIPGDKSISHRAVMFGALANGITEVENFLTGEDCIATINCFRQMGIKIEQNNTSVKIFGKGLFGLEKPDENLYVGNSGTTIRLMAGILAGQNFETTITGDESIEKRPMGRIIEPLKEMNGNISGINNSNFAPLNIKPAKLKGINYKQKVASAQVKSAIILASLYADTETTIYEPIPSRNHTELLLNYLGANIKTENGTITINNNDLNLQGKKIIVPGDISSASFFMVAGLICPGSEILIKNVGVNKTRNGIIEVLQKMNGHVKLLNQKEISGELVADIEVKYSKLKAVTVSGDIIPTMIDEIPILAVAAMFADGKTIIKDAEELKVKETDRIKAVVTEFNKLGGNLIETNDGMIINGNSNNFKGSEVESYKDHRIAMSLGILGLMIKEKVTIKDFDCVNISFPNFSEILENL